CTTLSSISIAIWLNPALQLLYYRPPETSRPPKRPKSERAGGQRTTLMRCGGGVPLNAGPKKEARFGIHIQVHPGGHMKKILVGVWLGILLLRAASGFAQTGNAQLGGIVQDASKALIPGVSITATNVDTGVMATQVTNESGAYNFPVLQPGTYRVLAELPG